MQSQNLKPMPANYLAFKKILAGIIANVGGVKAFSERPVLYQKAMLLTAAKLSGNTNLIKTYAKSWASEMSKDLFTQKVLVHSHL